MSTQAGGANKLPKIDLKKDGDAPPAKSKPILKKRKEKMDMLSNNSDNSAQSKNSKNSKNAESGTTKKPK